MKKRILISTGGSGGHVIPATVFYDQLKEKFDIILSTDKRGIKFLDINKYEVNIINTPKFSSNFFLMPISLFYLLLLTIKSFFFLRKKKINILISTGGYMSIPLCIAAKILSIEIYLFEPNMVLGRSNNFFLQFSKKIFCYSNKIINFPKKYFNKIILIEPLLRKEFYDISSKKNNEINNNIKILIIGGSQGAEVFDTEVKKTIVQLSKKYKINIYQQTTKENIKILKNFYNQNNILFNLFTFEEKFSNYIKDTNLCITRAGASTLSELTFLNIPYIAIPYQEAKDNHQFENALYYENKNCCWIFNQKDLKSDLLLNFLEKIIKNKDDYLTKKKNMKKLSNKNSWNKINQKLINVLNEN